MGHASAAKATAASVIQALRRSGTPERAKASAWFFKTAKGQYGYGDRFFGVTVPKQRQIARAYRSLPLSGVEALLQHAFHECRLTALFILVDQYRRASEETREAIVAFYLAQADRVNNWDLVDSSAPYILGAHLLRRDRRLLHEWARSENVWRRRIAVLAAGAFIREGEYEDTLALARLLLQDPHALIHKAVGWMLREVGKRSPSVLAEFLDDYAAVMPRTMLRYAIEKLSEQKRQAYLRQGEAGSGAAKPPTVSQS